jgi:hypothetical protein
MRFLVMALVVAAAGTAVAAEEIVGGRYAFVPTEKGVFRLDTETGEVSLCMVRDVTLVCLRAPASAAPPGIFDAGKDDRLAGLEARVAALEAGEGAEPVAVQGDTMRRVRTLAARAMGRLFALVGRMKGETAGPL